MATRKQSNTKDKIVEAASELFFEQGYQATTIDHVIERSGVSRPTLYTYARPDQGGVVHRISEGAPQD